MRWLALHLPALSLEAFAATLAPELRQRPLALVAAHRIDGVDGHAAARGVRAGMRRATALALAPDLLLAEADAVRDAAALRALADAALAFTPAVALHDAQTLVLEVQGSLRLFGGLAGLRGRLLDAVAPLGHRVEIAAAPTPLGAALLAQWQPPGTDLVLGPHAGDLAALRKRLAAAPLALLGATREQLEALQGMGLTCLADLRRLPRAGLARRFGDGLLTALDRACGERSDPRRWLEPASVFEGRIELYARAENTDQVLHGAAVLLARLVAWAQARRARIGAFTLHMLHERLRQAEVAPTELRIELAEPALALDHLQLLLRERLARCELAAPTLELWLHCTDLVAAPAPNGELFPTRAGADEGLTRLLERLCARLGEPRVQRLLPVADHRPERATRCVAAQGAAPRPGAAVAAALAAVAASPLPLHRPAWLLPEPLPLAERDALPLLEGRPLRLVSGPERIESGWWDGEPVARDYYIAQAADGSLVWIFRGRLPDWPHRSELGGAGDWHLQGRFG
ncbi:MAG: DNA polymerase Y family protein [Burkholderiales bacterium]|nr:DNA polymerase Y family protein [Burkholderiales bacterium]